MGLKCAATTQKRQWGGLTRVPRVTFAALPGKLVFGRFAELSGDCGGATGEALTAVESARVS